MRRLERQALASLVFAAFLVALSIWGCASTKPPKRVAEDPRAAYEWAIGRLAQDKCLHAQETLRLLSLEHAGVTYVDSIIYYLAEAYMCLSDYALAQIEYERIVNSYPSSALVDDAAFGLAYSQFKQAPKNPGLDQQEATAAIRTLEDFIAIYPRSDRRTEALRLLRDMRDRLAKKTFDSGRLYLRLGADSSATIYFQRLWDEYTESPYAARALWLLAEKARKSEDWDLAMRRYRQLIQVYPDAIEVKQAEMLLDRLEAADAKRMHKAADEARRGGQLAEALALYEKLLSTYPEYRRSVDVRTAGEEVRSALAAENESRAP